jgi:dTDP-glucose 4,6-dehydratase
MVIHSGKVGETYNVGGNNQPPNIEIVRTICRTLNENLPNSPNKPHESLIEFVADRPGHDRRYAMDISKIGSDLGWEPREWLESGLRKTIEWYLNHEDWVTAIQKQSDYQQWLDQNYQKRGEK